MSEPRDELDPPFEIIEPAACEAQVAFNSPHSGSTYPRDFLSTSRLDIATLRAILALTRDAPSERDRSELLRSVWRDGLAERVREHARRARDARAARRVNNG